MDITKIKSALVSGLLASILGVAGYIISVGDIFKLDYHSLINVGVLAALTTLVSLIKSSFTSNEGTIAGVRIK